MLILLCCAAPEVSSPEVDSPEVDSSGWQFDHGTIYSDLGRSDDIAYGDIDKDGLTDIVNNSNDNIYWYRNNGGSRPDWTRSSKIVPPHSDWSGEAGWLGTWVGDFDGDGDLDVVSGAKGDYAGTTHPTAWFENVDGRGGSWTEHPLPISGDYYDHARTHDFNGDGRDDIIIQKKQGGGVYYLPSPSDPSGTWPSYEIGAGANGMSLCDVDRDGDMDVLVNNTWLENPGNPASTNWTTRQVSSIGGVKNSCGDLNGDGYTDIVHTSEEETGICVYLGPADPKTGSWTQVTISTSHTGNHSNWLTDFDRDGDLDILTAEMHTKGQHRVTVFENADGGRDWTPHVMATTGSHNAIAVDVNKDGMPDIVGKNFTSVSGNPNPLEVWYNTLAATTSTTPPAAPPSVGSPPTAGLHLWFKADAGVSETTSNRVAQWNDQSSYGLHAIQTTDSKRPVYVENVINGRPIVRFDGVDDDMRFGTWDIDGLQAMSIAMVSANTRFQTSQYGDEGGEHGTTHAPINWHENGDWGTTYLSPFQRSISWRFGTGEPDNINVYLRPQSIEGEFTITVSVKNGTSEYLYLDRNLVKSKLNARATLANHVNYGDLARARGNTWFAGDIAEILVYAKALSDSERIQVQDYFRSKYFSSSLLSWHLRPAQPLLLLPPPPPSSLPRTANYGTAAR